MPCRFDRRSVFGVVFLAACSSSPTVQRTTDSGSAGDVVRAGDSGTDAGPTTDIVLTADVAPTTDVVPTTDLPIIDVTTPLDVATEVDAGMPSADAGPYDGGPPYSGRGVVTSQVDPQRTGAYVLETALTPSALMAGRFGRDTTFTTALDGNVYAQPLYLPGLTVGGASHDVLFAATESNTVFALDAATGATLWHTNLGTPVPMAMLSCGDVDPVGVLSTPVIDPVAGTLYAVAFTVGTGGLVFTLNALDVTTGMPRAGYPVPIAPTGFDPMTQEQRGALALIGGRLYVTFGWLYGHCPPFTGYVVGIDPAHPTSQVVFSTASSGAGIAAPGGVSTDGDGNIFVATGVSFGSPPEPFGNTVLRLRAGAAGPTYAGTTADYFTPSNAASLDSFGEDIGSTTPIVLPPVGGLHLLAQGGGSRVEYLLNADNLGGVGTGDGGTGEGAYSAPVTNYPIGGAQAAYSDGTHTWLFVPATGAACPAATAGGMVALGVTATGSSPTFSVQWCAGPSGEGALAVSANGATNAILWVVNGNETVPFIGAFQISDGTELWHATGTDVPTSIQAGSPPVIADGRVYITNTSGVQMYRLVR